MNGSGTTPEATRGAETAWDVVAAAKDALGERCGCDDDDCGWQEMAFADSCRELVPELIAEVERLRAVIFVVQEARVDYDAALFNREHGGVAADRFIRAVTAELDFTAGAA